jgi:type II secretion system protein J
MIAAINKTVRNRYAFTLIELLLAIGVTAVVLVAVSSLLFTALQTRNANADAIEAIAPVEYTLTIIRRDLMGIVAPSDVALISGDFKAGNVTSLGISELASLEMHTTTGNFRENEPWGEIQRVAYTLKNSSSATTLGRDLYRCVTRNILTYNTPVVDEQLMLQGVGTFQVLCYDGSQWTDLWDTSSSASTSTNLPSAVRVRIEMAHANAASAPVYEVVVPIHSQRRTNQVEEAGT